MIRQYKKTKKIIKRIKKKSGRYLRKKFVFFRYLGKLKKKFHAMWYSCFHAIDEQLIVFKANKGSDYSGFPAQIYEQLINDEKYESYKFAWLFNDIKNYKYLNNNRKTRVYASGSRKGIKMFKKARYIVTNSELQYYQKKRKRQVLIFEPEEQYMPLLYLGKNHKIWKDSQVSPEELKKYQIDLVASFADFVIISNERNRESMKEICSSLGNNQVKFCMGNPYFLDYLNENENNLDEEALTLAEQLELPEESKKVLISLTSSFALSYEDLESLNTFSRNEYSFLFRKAPCYKKSDLKLIWQEEEKKMAREGITFDKAEEARQEKEMLEEFDELVEQEEGAEDED